MSGTELIMGMGEVINYLKDLEAENKKLKAELGGALEELESVQPDGRCLLYEVDMLGLKVDDEREENKKLKEELQLIKDEAKCFSEVFKKIDEENKKLKEEIKQYKEAESLLLVQPNPEAFAEKIKELKQQAKQEEMYLSAVEALKFMDHEWDEEGKGWIDKEESESEEEEELTKYEKEDSDWAYGYGFTVKDGEYRINMAGGGDHWEDYVINKDGCFIHNGCGESQVKSFISCPEGNYIKVVHIGEDYELEEGETDMYEMVQECFIEEIMEYEKQEDHIPTDSDEEEEEE